MNQIAVITKKKCHLNEQMTQNITMKITRQTKLFAIANYFNEDRCHDGNQHSIVSICVFTEIILF